VLRMALGPADLARVRVAVDLHRAAMVMLVCQALRDPAVAAALPDLAGRAVAASARLRPLQHLVQPRGFAPDFLTPLDGVESLDAGLQAIRSAPARQIRAEVAAASSSSEHLTALRAAGLVSSQRSGGAVVHRATALGARMCGECEGDSKPRTLSAHIRVAFPTRRCIHTSGVARCSCG
jgi:DNA-binding transcriptional ArsR family regulator